MVRGSLLASLADFLFPGRHGRDVPGEPDTTHPPFWLPGT